MADHRPPLTPGREGQVVVLEAGPRSIVGRVLFFRFLGLLVLVLAAGQAISLIARERRVAAATAADSRDDLRVLTTRRVAPEFGGGIEDGRMVSLAGARDSLGRSAANRRAVFSSLTTTCSSSPTAKTGTSVAKA